MPAIKKSVVSICVYENVYYLWSVGSNEAPQKNKRIMKNLLLALGLATVLFTSCNKEDLPAPGDRCGAGQVTQVGIKKDENVGPGDRFDYYVWFIDDCTGELLRDEIDQGEFNTIEVGDYYTK